MTPDTQAVIDIAKKFKNNFEFFASKCLKIRTESGSIEPFILNKTQKYIHARLETQRAETGKVRALVLKGRQQGASTLIEARYYWRTTHNFGVRAFILTHEDSATANLFEMAKRYHDNCPDIIKPKTKASNSTELIFDEIDSGYKLGTAGNKSVGRSSTIQFLHASEAAFYKHADEHAKGIMQAVPNVAGTEVIIESTANGVGNWFHQQWQLAESGQSEFIAVFTPWFWKDTYRKNVSHDFIATPDEQELKDIYHIDDEQLAWRRMKIVELSVNGLDGLKSFKQEYPNNATEAFQMSGEDSFIHPDIVMLARNEEKYNNIERIGALTIGVDIARFGDDRTAIIRRRGRVAYGLQTHCKKDTMEISGIVHNIIINENPVKVFIDVCGLGAGVFDRLLELGHKDIIVAVNSAEKALDDDHYSNKRAEMWALAKQWLIDKPVQIPDSDELHADLCTSKYKVDSKGRVLIESKADMKKRGVRSSDTADALLLTFALPVSALVKSINNDSSTAKTIMSGMLAASKAKKARYSH